MLAVTNVTCCNTPHSSICRLPYLQLQLPLFPIRRLEFVCLENVNLKQKVQKTNITISNIGMRPEKLFHLKANAQSILLATTNPARSHKN